MRIDPGIERILVPVDLGPGSRLLFTHALKLALCTGARLTAVFVGSDPDAVVSWTGLPDVADLLVSWGVLGKGATEDDVRSLGLHIDREARVASNTRQGVVGAVIEQLPNIIVVGTAGRQGLDRLRHGSVAEAIARRSGAVTLFIPAASDGFIDPDSGRVKVDTVLFPVGGKVEELQHAVDVLGAFLDVLRVRDTRVIVVHVGDDSLPQISVEARQGWRWEVDRRQGDVADAIPAAITAAIDRHKADLVVMATRGHDSLGDMLRGSKTEQVLRRASCPVLAVPVG